MDGKRMILIVNFLGRIQVVFRKRHGKAAVLPGVRGKTSFFIAITLIKYPLNGHLRLGPVISWLPLVKVIVKQAPKGRGVAQEGEPSRRVRKYELLRMDSALQLPKYNTNEWIGI